METRGEIPETILVEIVARLPLRSVARFKSVSKRWKSIVESMYFRRRFVSMHKNSSTSWSLMSRTEYGFSLTGGEAVGFYGCETWNLPKSIGSYILPFQDYSYLASSNGLIWINAFVTNLAVPRHVFYVGNPVLQKWVEIPPHRGTYTSTPSGLVTRVEDGVVLGFKLVMSYFDRLRDSRGWYVDIYSSETGEWCSSSRRLECSHPVIGYDFDTPVSLDGKLYLCESDTAGFLVDHDFYTSADQCQVIPLPYDYHNQYSTKFSRALSTSGRDVMYIEIRSRRLKVWKLDDKSVSGEWWNLLWDIDTASLPFGVNYIPVAMDPFDTHVMYLWSRREGCLVSGNLRTNEFNVHGESECCSINMENCKECMENMNHTSQRSWRTIMLPQFVLPQWMESVCPVDATPFVLLDFD